VIGVAAAAEHADCVHGGDAERGREVGAEHHVRGLGRPGRLNIAANGSTCVTWPCTIWNPRGTFIHAFAVTMKNADATEDSAIGSPTASARAERADPSENGRPMIRAA
jgi:hypothetical protein